MLLQSFRLRLAIISATVSGMVLLAFGGVSWVMLSRQRLAALDAELQLYGFRVAGRAGSNVDGARTEANMLEIYGVDKAPFRFFSLVRQPDGEILHSTASWPEGLAAVRFAPGADPLDPQPEIPESPRPPRESRQAGGNRNRPPRPRTILEPRFESVQHGGRRYRIGTFANPELRMVLGADLDQFASDMRGLRNALLMALPGALVLIALGAGFVSRRALGPVRAISERMERLSTRALDQRVDAGTADLEFRRIVDAYNSMSERLERSFHQATRFSADASHELKTPLAVMQGTLEQALASSPEGSDEQRVYSSLLDEVRHQLSIVDGLLLLARADAGQLELSREELDLGDLLGTLVEDAGMLGEAKRVTVDADLAEGVVVEADPVLLQQALHNLISNAVKYNREDGRLVCSLVRSGVTAEIRIANTGDSIPAGQREKVFDRFYRRSDREPSEEGSGLGLSLAREIVVAHGGVLTLEDDSPEGMTTFRVRLPAGPVTSASPNPQGAGCAGSRSSPTKFPRTPR